MEINMKKILISLVFCIACLITFSNQSRADWGPFESTIKILSVQASGISSFYCSASITLIDSDPAITQKGFCWSTAANPDISLSTKTLNGSGPGIGPSSLSFSTSITGLQQSTAYHIRAYATNSDGTSYSDDVTCTTIPTLPEWGLITMIVLFAGAGGWKTFPCGVPAPAGCTPCPLFMP